MKRFGDERDWVFKNRLGLFVHWGLYAIPARQEQIQLRQGIHRKKYEKLIREFNPLYFNPDAWLDLAEEAGMKYVCFTTKHHDGFCLWNTSHTDFNVMNSPFGKDILAMLAEACGLRNFPLCLYYSIVDWHHPNYPNQNRSHELADPEAGDEPSLEKYMEFLKAQVYELCTQYGEIHGFWWDQNAPGFRDPSVNDMIRSLQPKAVVNDRGFDGGDFGTPERDWDKHIEEVTAFDQPIEACQSVGKKSWGYKKDEDYYSCSYLIRSIDNILAKGGNYLLNVGPKADGTIPLEAEEILRTIGKWYHKVKEAFENTEPASDMTENRELLLTRTGNTLYVHLVKEPTNSGTVLKPIDMLPRRAILVNTGQKVNVSMERVPTVYDDKKEYLIIDNPSSGELNDTVIIVKLEFDKLKNTWENK